MNNFDISLHEDSTLLASCRFPGEGFIWTIERLPLPEGEDTAPIRVQVAKAGGLVSRTSICFTEAREALIKERINTQSQSFLDNSRSVLMVLETLEAEEGRRLANRLRVAASEGGAMDYLNREGFF